jgi:membrane protease YdiL (CAAX protease family)
MYKQTNYSPLGQIGMFIAFLGVGFVLAAVALMGLASMMNVPLMQMEKVLTDPQYLDFIKWSQALSTFFIMAVPAFLFGLVVYKKPFEFLGFSQRASIKQRFFVLLLLFPALFLTGALGELNKMIPISADLAAKFKTMEDAYTKQVLLLANMKTFAQYLSSLLILAILPAFFEEMLFRGGLQKMLTNISHKPWFSIILTSIIFSLFHASYYGFLPRLFLGILLGYIFHVSRNIWLSILFHFLNNALVVSQMYYYSTHGKLSEKVLDETVPISYGLIGLPLVLVLCHFFKKESTNVLGANITEEVIGEKPQEL